MKNYRSAYIDGSRNLRASSFKDHAHTSMYKKATNLYKKHQGRDLIEYSPLARVLATMDSATREVMAEIAYMIAKEKLSFSKMKPFVTCKNAMVYTLAKGTRMTIPTLHLLSI